MSYYLMALRTKESMLHSLPDTDSELSALPDYLVSTALYFSSTHGSFAGVYD